MVRQAAERFDKVRIETDFLPCFAQRRCLGRAVARIDPAAWKTHLARMAPHMRCSPGQQNPGGGPAGKADENSSGYPGSTWSEIDAVVGGHSLTVR